ncbi:MAG: PIN domain-containing protein [Pseudomonadota bacterium]
MAYLLDTNVLTAVRDAVPPIEARRLAVDLFVATMDVLAFGVDDARAYSDIVSNHGYSRRKRIDEMIAAQALEAGATLVALNGADFADIDGLTILDWGAHYAN